MATSKPDMDIVWGRDSALITEPSGTKKANGWIVEKPPVEYANWVQNRGDTYAQHLNQHGIPEWDNTTSYVVGALTLEDETVWQAQAINAAEQPSTDDGTYWRTFGIMQPTTYTEDSFQDNAAATSTWFTVTDYSGAGVVWEIGGRVNVGGEGSIYLDLEITTDGNVSVHDLTTNPTSNRILVNYDGFNADGARIRTNMGFDDNFKFRIGHTQGAPLLLNGIAIYGIYSEEFKREIIPAGEVIPVPKGRKPRPEGGNTYPVDTMLVWYTGKRGIANKVVQLPPPKVHMRYDYKRNKFFGELKKYEFNTDEIGLSRPKHIVAKLEEDRTYELVEYAGKTYRVPIVKGDVVHEGITLVNREIVL